MTDPTGRLIPNYNHTDPGLGTDAAPWPQVVADKVKIDEHEIDGILTSDNDESSSDTKGVTAGYVDNKTAYHYQPPVTYYVRGTLIGNVDVNGTAVTWVSGVKFLTTMAGNIININSVEYTVDSVASESELTLTSSAGTGTGIGYIYDAELGDDTNDGLTWETAKATIQPVIDSLGKALGGYATIRIGPGDYSSDGVIEIARFSQAGRDEGSAIILVAYDGTTQHDSDDENFTVANNHRVHSIRCLRNNCVAALRTITVTGTTSNNGVNILGGRARLNSVNHIGDGGGNVRAFNVVNSPCTVFFVSCSASGTIGTALNVTDGAIVISNNWIDTGTHNSGLVSTNSIIYKQGTQPSGDEVRQHGGQIFPNIVQTQFPMYTDPPTKHTSPGIKGQRAAKGIYIYECVATNTWRRNTTETEFNEEAE